jgi:hypothetical protein
MLGFVSLVSVFAMLMASPAAVRAEAATEGASAETGATPSEAPPAARGLRRWHPDAYKTPDGETLTEVQIEYVEPAPTRTEEERLRNKRVAIGVSVTLVLVFGAAIGTGVAMSSFMNWD